MEVTRIAPPSVFGVNSSIQYVIQSSTIHDTLLSGHIPLNTHNLFSLTLKIGFSILYPVQIVQYKLVFGFSSYFLSVRTQTSFLKVVSLLGSVSRIYSCNIRELTSTHSSTLSLIIVYSRPSNTFFPKTPRTSGKFYNRKVDSLYPSVTSQTRLVSCHLFLIGLFLCSYVWLMFIRILVQKYHNYR